ncbi:MAG: cytochrome c [Gammaproteobacteria bacterium]|nr:cytochrome c [Gammaproteobacteria bacterium]NNK97720.1 cytochrome c [Xanthomonadales bacterium]
MKRLAFVLGLLVLAAGSVLFVTRPVGLPEDSSPAHQVDLANGERIFYAGGCTSCHASVDSEPDSLELGGGLEMETPFGVFRVPNISPHAEAGIGQWTMLDFVNAMLLGTSPDGRHYYPAFPYASYSRMSFGDLIDLKFYLDTLPQSDNQPAGHSLKFPFNIRAGLGVWKLFNLKPEYVVTVPEGDLLLQRGRYLVEGPGHCGECHTARDWTGGMDLDRWLAGGPNPEGEGKVPNISPHIDGLKTWEAGDIEYYLESGFTPDYDSVGGSMVKVQENMARLPAEDRAAIAAYLKSIPALGSSGSD